MVWRTAPRIAKRTPGPAAVLAVATVACSDPAAVGEIGTTQSDATGPAESDGGPADDTATSGTGGTVADETGTSGTITSTDDSDDGRATGEPIECRSSADCDDDNPCSVDSCSAGRCAFVGTETTQCRPTIDVVDPPRGATVLGMPGGVVMVSGSVSTGLGHVASLTLNGDNVPIADDDTFVAEFDPVVGGNTLVFEAVDANGWRRRRVQSLLWGTSYRAPTGPLTALVPDGVRVYLAEGSLDDTVFGLPPDDLATVMQVALAELDVEAAFDIPTPVGIVDDYAVHVTALEVATRTVALLPTDDGVVVTTTLGGITGGLGFDCTAAACEADGGDGTGGFIIEAVVVQTPLSALVDATPAVAVAPAASVTSIEGLQLGSNDAWTDPVAAASDTIVTDSAVANLVAGVDAIASSRYGPVLQTALSQLRLDAALAFPSIGQPGTTIDVALQTQPQTVVFSPLGAVVRWLGGASTPTVVTPHDNLGIPDRLGCDGQDDVAALPQEELVEIGVTDDLLNQLFYAAWRGGMLEFPLTIADGEIDGVTDVEIVASGPLAITVSDCNRMGAPRALLGDVRFDAALTYRGQPLTFVAHTSAELAVQLDLGPQGITIAIPELVSSETELSVGRSDAIGDEALLIEQLEAALHNQLLTADTISPLPLPPLEFSEALGLEPGAAVMEVVPESVVHRPGISVIRGHL